MQTFLILYRPGLAWMAGKPVSEQPLEEHGRYLLHLYRAGTLRFAGPLADNAGGAAVIEVGDEGAAHAIAADDPAVRKQVFVYELHPWQLVPWERYIERG